MDYKLNTERKKAMFLVLYEEVADRFLVADEVKAHVYDFVSSLSGDYRKGMLSDAGLRDSIIGELQKAFPEVYSATFDTCKKLDGVDWLDLRLEEYGISKSKLLKHPRIAVQFVNGEKTDRLPLNRGDIMRLRSSDRGLAPSDVLAVHLLNDRSSVRVFPVITRSEEIESEKFEKERQQEHKERLVARKHENLGKGSSSKVLYRHLVESDRANRRSNTNSIKR